MTTASPVGAASPLPAVTSHTVTRSLSMIGLAGSARAEERASAVRQTRVVEAACMVVFIVHRGMAAPLVVRLPHAGGSRFWEDRHYGRAPGRVSISNSGGAVGAAAARLGTTAGCRF